MKVYVENHSAVVRLADYLSLFQAAYPRRRSPDIQSSYYHP